MANKKKSTTVPEQSEPEPEIQGYCPGCEEPRINEWIWHKPCCPYDPGENCPPEDDHATT